VASPSRNGGAWYNSVSPVVNRPRRDALETVALGAVLLEVIANVLRLYEFRDSPHLLLDHIINFVVGSGGSSSRPLTSRKLLPFSAGPAKELHQVWVVD